MERWPDPAPMETGAPEPVLLKEGDTLWVAYRARDPLFPGWDDPVVAEYVDANPGEPFAVLRFDGVRRYSIGPPSDERQYQHPLYSQGLELYSFHVLEDASEEERHWIVTFHDETLEVRARAAHAYPPRFLPSAEEGIVNAQHAVEQAVAADGAAPRR